MIIDSTIKILSRHLLNKIFYSFVSKTKIENYYESGQYEAEVKAIIYSAIQKLSTFTWPDNAAVVFDVDETALSNYDFIKSQKLSYRKKVWRTYVKRAEATVNQPVKLFYDWLIERGVKIVFLTGRRSDEFDATSKNLNQAGYKKFSKIICRSEKEEQLAAVFFKIEKRKELENNGFKIIATIGDQPNDIIGPATGLKIKIPNLLYFN